MAKSLKHWIVDLEVLGFRRPGFFFGDMNPLVHSNRPCFLQVLISHHCCTPLRVKIG